MDFETNLSYRASVLFPGSRRPCGVQVLERRVATLPTPEADYAPVAASFVLPGRPQHLVEVRAWDGRFWMSGFRWRRRSTFDDRAFLDDPCGHLFPGEGPLTAADLRLALATTPFGRARTAAIRSETLDGIRELGGSVTEDSDRRHADRPFLDLVRTRIVVGGLVHVACGEPTVRRVGERAEIALDKKALDPGLLPLASAPADLVARCRIEVARPDLLRPF